MLLALVDGGSPAEPGVVAPQLRVRASTVGAVR
jgi:hypothetical protein